ncbi:MAG: BREX-1 system phosphatase PglZ type A [Lachnospiraceae bacterium]|nr:BREX-1 system phosphatase PglZ type A [Lachnospiraceae bacterium]
MDELNLQEIEKKLNTEYQNGQRLVFWYDTEASFEEEVDQLDLPDVQIVHLTEKNAFRVKMMLEHEEPQKRFLIYAPFEKPDYSVNHLEDTLLYSREFYADRLSLIAADCKLPARLRVTLESLKDFFNAGKDTGKAGKRKLSPAQKKAGNARVNDFIERSRDFDMAEADEDLVMIIAMCVVAKARNTTIDGLYYAVFSYGDCEDMEAGRMIGEFARFGLDQAFWSLTERRFGYDDPKPNLLKFIMSLFAVYTFRENPEEAPADWKIFMQDKMKRQSSNISVLLENMMNSVIYQERFDELSELASDKLHVSEVLKETPLECLVTMGAFQAVDDVLIRWMVERIIAEDKNAAIDGHSMIQLCDIREKLHFGQKYAAEYQVIRSARHLLEAVGYLPEDDLSAQIKAYAEKNYYIDMEYRHFIAAYDQIEDTAVFEEMRDLIQNIYSTEYLEKLVYSWNLTYEKNAQQELIPLQRDFYEDEVRPVREKVVVIISDAFRYEAAKELEALFAEDQNCTAVMKMKMGTLPAVTAVGMAELLPHKTISMTEDKPFKILVDGKPCGTTAQREQILQSANPKSAAIDFDSANQMKVTELRSFTAGKEVIYVYHNRVDATGETMRTEDSVFAAVSDSIRELFKLVKTFSKSGNVYRFLITADHGFIYTRKPLEATDKLENEAEKEALSDRRFIISRSNLTRMGIYAVTLGAAWRNEDPRYINLAKGMSVFKCGGGMNYVHGGSSPQELLIPTLFIKTQRGVVDTEDAVINLISDIRKVTNLRLRLDFYQEKPVSDMVKAATYRIHFVSNEGELISNEVIYKADHKEEKAGDRIVTLGFDIKRKNYDSNHRYFLKVINDKTNVEILSRQVIMDLPFTDDFGFGV